MFGALQASEPTGTVTGPIPTGAADATSEGLRRRRSWNLGTLPPPWGPPCRREKIRGDPRQPESKRQDTEDSDPWGEDRPPRRWGGQGHREGAGGRQRQHRLRGLTVMETVATADTNFPVCAGACAFMCMDSFLPPLSPPIIITSGGCQQWFIWQCLLCTTKFSQTNIYSKTQTRGVITELGETLTWPGDECQPGWETGTMTLGVLSFMRGINLSLFL